jgi:ABC-type Zn uptake system ZnuABC Zn-binding protein ZnuA
MHEAGLAERIAREAGVALGPALYTDALGPPGSGAATYEELIRANTEAIVATLTAPAGAQP